MSNQIKGVLFAALTALLWGVLAVVLKITLKEVDTLTITWFRFAFAFLSLLAYYLIKSPSQIRIFLKPPRLLVLAAVGLSFNYYGFLEGVNLAGPRAAQVIIQTGPVLLSIAGILIFKERFKGKQIVGIFLLVLGLGLFFKENMELLSNTSDLFIKGTLFTFMGAATWATYGVCQKILVKKYPVQQLNLFLYGFAATIYSFLVDFSGFLTMSLEVWLLMTFLGINTLVAYWALGTALKLADAGKVSVVIATNPLVTFFFVAVLEMLNINIIEVEQLPAAAYLGAALVIIGAVIAIQKPREKIIS